MRRKNYNPFLLRIMMLSWNGMAVDEIAARIGWAVEDVNKLFKSEQAQHVYAQLEAQTIETYQQTQVALAAMQPSLLQEKYQLAMTATREAVKCKALQDLLDMGGHGAVRHVEIRRPDQIEEEFKDKSEAEIRQELLADLSAPLSPETTVH